MSYCSAEDPRIFFGLGKHDKVDMLEIRWPSGIVDRFQNLPVDDFVIVEEGNREARAVRLSNTASDFTHRRVWSIGGAHENYKSDFFRRYNRFTRAAKTFLWPQVLAS